MELPVYPAALDLVRVEVVELQHAACDELVERLRGTAARVFHDETIVHLVDVGRIAAGDHRRELGPMIRERTEFAGGYRRAFGLGPEIGNGERTVGAGLAAPPIETQGVRLCEGRPGQAGSEQRRAAHEKLASIETKSHCCPPG